MACQAFLHLICNEHGHKAHATEQSGEHQVSCEEKSQVVLIGWTTWYTNDGQGDSDDHGDGEYDEDGG
jgi:regulator of RNase E activity RraB